MPMMHTKVHISKKKKAHEKVGELSLGGFTLHYIPGNVHVGSSIEHIPQDKHTH